MVQNLLASRFKLKFHIEKRNLKALVLTVDKPGKLQVNTNADLPEAGRLPITMAGYGGLKGERVDMPYFVWWFASNILKEPVVDKTGLTGFYDFKLHFSPRLTVVPDAEVPDDAFGPPIYKAFKDQLGLKLTRMKAPVEVIVIDHAEKPSAN